MIKKNALITGATDGIGKAIAKKLLEENWKVVIIGRNNAKCEKTVVELKALTKNNDVSAITADLSSMQETKIACEKFLESNQNLDLLLLNANAIANERIITKEGFEQNFALGYLSRALMITKLDNVLKNTVNSQILSVIGMSYNRLDFDDINLEKKFKGFFALTRWQWSIIVHSLEYNRQSSIPLNLYMPGLVKTKILANEPQPMRALVKIMNVIMGISVEKSAENIFNVQNEISSKSKKGTIYSWSKEKSFPKIEMQEGDTERLIALTKALLEKY